MLFARFRQWLAALIWLQDSDEGGGGGVVDRKLRLVFEVDEPEIKPTRRAWLKWEFSEPTLEFAEEEGRLPDLAEAVDLQLEEEGRPGLRWSRGLPTTHENNIAFRPTLARGRNGRLGTYHELFVTSTTYRRGWSGIAQALVTGVWKIAPEKADDFTPEEEAEGKRRAKLVHQALIKNLKGGWSRFVCEALYMLVAGFAIFEEVYREVDDEFGLAGSIEKLAFRYPGTVEEWILDEWERELLAVKFNPGQSSGAGEYVLPAEDLLLYTYDQFGNNYEGIPPMRSAARWIQALQLLQQLEMIAAEKYGSPWTFARNTGENRLPKKDRDRLVDIIEDAVAAENPILVLPEGVEIEISSPGGQMPDFEPAKRFCLERTAEVLKAEGSLIGLGQTGAFAARMDASSEFIRFAPYFAKLITDPLNGTNNEAHTGTIPKMYRAMFGEPLRAGDYPTLKFSIGDLEDQQAMAKLQQAAAVGAVEVTPEVKEHVHDKLNLPEPPKDLTGNIRVVRGGADAG